tara:strand:- start:6036 stop:6227 length:192 start_codon:yes stop_codon:yes gene_type:complete
MEKFKMICCSNNNCEGFETQKLEAHTMESFIQTDPKTGEPILSEEWLLWCEQCDEVIDYDQEM